MVQEDPAASVLPQLLVAAKAPEATMELMASGVVVLRLVSVRFCAALAPVLGTPKKESGPPVSVTVGAVPEMVAERLMASGTPANETLLSGYVAELETGPSVVDCTVTAARQVCPGVRFMASVPQSTVPAGSEVGATTWNGAVTTSPVVPVFSVSGVIVLGAVDPSG